MTKRELIKWLEEKEKEAENTICSQCSDEIKRLKDEFKKSIELDNVALQLSVKFNEISKIYSKLEKVVKEKSEESAWLRNSAYASLPSQCNKFGTSESAKDELNNYLCLYDYKPIVELENKKNELISGIRENYNKVILTVTNLKNAKLGIAYLEELGFDLSEISIKDEKPCTTLVAQVDTSYLFIAKENTAAQ